jgi:hypothetical protein
MCVSPKRFPWHEADVKHHTLSDPTQLIKHFTDLPKGVIIDTLLRHRSPEHGGFDAAQEVGSLPAAQRASCTPPIMPMKKV